MWMFKIKKRRLPHWRIPESLYFLTFRVHPEQVNLNDDEKTLITKSLKFFNQDRYDLYAYVVMDDHCHVIVQPFNEQPLEKITHSWLSFSAHELQKTSGRTGSIWQREPYDRIIRSQNDLAEKTQYIIENPWRKNGNLTEYKWVGSKKWLYNGLFLQNKHIHPVIDFLP
jgi:putative transposase